MGWFKDEKRSGRAADIAAELLARRTGEATGRGGKRGMAARTGDLYSHRNIKTGPITSIKDTINFLRGK